MKKLTPQQIVFLNNVLMVAQDGGKHMSDYEAYRLAYPNVKKKGSAKAGASRLLKQPNVVAYIAKRTGEIESATNLQVAITKERILQEEGLIAFNDIGDIFDESGNILSINKMPEAARRAISSIKEKSVEIAGVVTKTYEIKLNEKGRSLDRLEKCFGMQKDSVAIGAVITIKGLLEEIDGSTRGKLPIDLE
jgi:hypothetical protein